MMRSITYKVRFKTLVVVGSGGPSPVGCRLVSIVRLNSATHSNTMRQFQEHFNAWDGRRSR